MHGPLNFPHREISYQLHLRSRGSGTADNCFGLLGEREGVELAMRSSSVSTWTPLQLDFFDNSNDVTSMEVIRGHSVTVTGSTMNSVTKQVIVCGDLLNTQYVQFRWMASAHLDGDSLSIHDVWALSNVTANLVTENGTNSLFEDSFGDDVIE
jgi:hypothetical protein